MATLEDSFLADHDELSDNEAELKVEETTVLEDDPEYKLIVDCHQLSVDIENEIAIVDKFIRDKYRLRFQELESLVNHPIDYARVVKKIGNQTDLTLVDLEDLLPSAIITVVSVTALTTKGNPLPEDVLKKTLEACDRALELDSARKKVLDFVESKMASIAPNLSAIVGSAVAAKLMGIYRATSVSRVGYLKQTEIFQSTPPSCRIRTGRLLAEKSTLAARVDATRGDPSGTNGKALREMIRKEIEKWQEPPPATQPKDEIDGDDGKEVDMDTADLETLNYDDLDTVSKLPKSQRYVDIMQRVQKAHRQVAGLKDHYQGVSDTRSLRKNPFGRVERRIAFWKRAFSIARKHATDWPATSTQDKSLGTATSTNASAKEKNTEKDNYTPYRTALKMMTKMGYTPGSGLGKKSQGRLQPLEVTVLPKITCVEEAVALMKQKDE